ncbi:hypothetical protein AC1031_008347 [Aphanomyces cochlioides]|nr:hypothetical protein AC1031_008347 [Aphanomyces cochlioides]
MFPGAPLGLRYIQEFALASLVFHYDYLKSVLSLEHPLLSTPLFMNIQLVDRLKSLVSCGNYNLGSNIRPTGIPPHVAILSELTTVLDHVKATMTALESAKGEIIRSIHVGEQNANDIGSSVTYNGIERSSGALRQHNADEPPTPNDSQPVDCELLYPTVPSNFIVPNGTAY